MLSRVARILLAAPAIGRVVIVTQHPDALLALAPGWIRQHPRIAAARGGDGIAETIAGLAGREAAPWPVLVTTADHPLLTTAMIEHFVDGAGDADLAVAMAERRIVLAAYPDNLRTWLKLADGAWSGCNLFALGSDRVAPALAVWAEVEQDRKKARRLLGHFGPWLAIRALTRTIGLGDAIGRAGRRLGITARLVAMPQAEAAIDVDKPADLALASRILAARERGSA